MKNLKILVLMWLPLALHGQTGTTIDEWLYASKGYSQDIELGREPSNGGYTFEKGHIYKNYNEETDIEFIEMTKGGKPRVTIMIETQGRYTWYYALPVGKTDNEVAGKFFSQFNSTRIPWPRLKVILAAINDYRFTCMLRE